MLNIVDTAKFVSTTLQSKSSDPKGSDTEESDAAATRSTDTTSTQLSSQGSEQAGTGSSRFTSKGEQARLLTSTMSNVSSTSRQSKPSMLDSAGDITVGSFNIAVNEVTIGRCIGSGSFGKVFEGKYARAPVAIKQLSGDMSAKAVRELKMEAAVMANLRSPFIVQFYGICFDEPHYLLLMEFMPRGSLYSVLNNDALSLPWTERLVWAQDVASGVCFLHARRPVILHRDLKSLNVLVTNEGRGKLTDFGLAQVCFESSSTQTAVKGVGSVPWMAPELFKRKAEVRCSSRRTQLYHFVCCLCLLCFLITMRVYVPLTQTYFTIVFCISVWCCIRRVCAGRDAVRDRGARRAVQRRC
jgi:hypothetical protein